MQMQRAAFPCAAVLILAGAVFPQQAPPQWVDPDRSEPPGLIYRTFHSSTINADVSYLIYLPPTYRTPPERRFPVVYWLHGLGGNQRTGATFTSLLDAAVRNGRAPAMIAVLVNGMRDNFYCDLPGGKRPMESVIVKDLVPHIDATYRTIARREARAVEGYSMGGYGAARLAFKYPELFGAAGVMAGALLDLDKLNARRPHIFPSVFNSDRAFWEANHPFTLLEKNADAIRGRTRIRVACGDRDELQPESQDLHERLRRLKIEHEYEVVPGVAHSGNLFYAALGDRAFAFYQRLFGPGGARRSPGTMFQVTSAPSRVIRDGDVEILTYETEQDYRRLQQLLRETQKTVPQPGRLTTLYFRSRTDNSVQPYAVRLPPGYDAAKKYPLVVQLHGLNFKETLSGQRVGYRGMRAEHWIEPHLPVIYAHSFGRPSGFYIGMAEEDVLETVEEVSRRFAVDGSRVYIMGHSMGGAGSYTVGLHYPDRFGGITPADAAMGGHLAPPADTPEWMKPQVAIHNPPNLYPNARNVNVFFKNAGAGIQGRSTVFTDGIVGQGGFSTSESFPGVPHGMAQFFSYASFVPQLVEHPIPRKPAEVKFYTNTLRYNRAYWITIDSLARHNADAFVFARWDDGKDSGRAAIRVTTTNVAALTIRAADTPAAPGAPLIVDGQDLPAAPLPAEVRIARRDGRWQAGAPAPEGRVKRHGLQGPIGDAFNSRFLAVYGEKDRDLAIAELDAIRNPPGPLCIHGDFPMKEASKLTRSDIETSNLILFGTPETNPVLKRLAPSLPSPPGGSGGALPVFIYPNPENPSRYVVVWSARLLSSPDHGIRAGWIMPLNLLPDYVLVRDGKVVRGGHFDGNWELRR